MTDSMQLNRPVSQAHHLLGQPTSLAEHFDAHGPLAAPIGRHSPAKQKLMADLAASGLTGRGGGGFPTAQKVAVVQRGRRGGAVVVNAMEGEPASDKDKVLLSRTPHLVLDGAAVSGRPARCRPGHCLRPGQSRLDCHVGPERNR